jgi:putative phosphoribosyl transferase
MFWNRSDAGIQLALKLGRYRGRGDTIILALPRGGVATGYELARALNAPLDVLIVRKIGFPGQQELAVGAVSETGTVVLNQSIISSGGVSSDYIQAEGEQQKQEIARRIALYRAGKSLPALEGKTVILVDDGVATGATIKAAIETLKQEKLARLVVALPVGPPETVDALRTMVDDIVCLLTPKYFTSVGIHYQDFTQVSDQEVVDLLKKAAAVP